MKFNRTTFQVIIQRKKFQQHECIANCAFKSLLNRTPKTKIQKTPKICTYGKVL